MKNEDNLIKMKNVTFNNESQNIKESKKKIDNFLNKYAYITY